MSVIYCQIPVIIKLNYCFIWLKTVNNSFYKLKYLFD